MHFSEMCVPVAVETSQSSGALSVTPYRRGLMILGTGASYDDVPGGVPDWDLCRL